MRAAEGALLLRQLMARSTARALQVMRKAAHRIGNEAFQAAQCWG